MERSRPVSPPLLLSDPERHEDDFKLSPIKLTRPQKRRRRADRQAVRDALINTSALKSALATENFDTRTWVNPACPVSDTPGSIHFRLQALESKIDQLLCAVLPGFQYSCVDATSMEHQRQPDDEQVMGSLGFCNYYGEVDPIESADRQMSTVLQYMTAATPEYVSKDAREDAEAEPRRANEIEARLEQLEQTSLDQEARMNEREKATKERIKAIEQHFDAEVYRVQANHEHDYSKLVEKIKSFPAAKPDSCKLPVEQNVQNERATSSTHVPESAGFDSMQKGLYRKFSNSLRSLQPEQRDKRIADLTNNLNGQPEGSEKTKQMEVLLLLRAEWSTNKT